MQLQRNRQFKEQFIHRVNDNDMIVEIIKELIKSEADKDVKLQVSMYFYGQGE